jgi:hypothetical protein
MDVELPKPPAEDVNWDGILAWLPHFTAEEFQAGRWAGGEEVAPGVRPMPWVDYADDVADFIRQLRVLHVVASFDWIIWMRERGNVFWKDPKRLAEASLEDCRLLLTAHVQADRFSEGHLLRAFESGHIVSVLQRVATLLDGRET